MYSLSSEIPLSQHVIKWIEYEAKQRGLSITDTEIRVIHDNPWSRIWHITTSQVDWYFKETKSEDTCEASLASFLAERIPELVLPVISANLSSGWILMPDGGVRMRELLRADRDIARWETALSQYASVQVALVPCIDDLQTMGVPDRRLARLPGLYEDLVAAVEQIELNTDEGLTRIETGHLRYLSSATKKLCTELAAFSIPETLHHGDLHDGNIFWRHEQPVFFDWGDASITHPFFSLRTVFVSVEISLNTAPDSPIHSELRDTYLKGWSSFASPEDLRRAFNLAQVLSPIISALSWYQTIKSLDDVSRLEYGRAVHLLLREYMANANRQGYV